MLSAAKGNSLQLPKAQAICNAIGCPLEEIFSVEKDTRPLSNKTIIEYHRFISAVLAQAEKEMIVEYNAAAKATPPKLDTPEADSFQLDEVERIRDCLEHEPLKWKVATHLFLISGCRRGEIAGLKWDRVDWENSQVKIDHALLSSNRGGVYEDTTKTSTTPLHSSSLRKRCSCCGEYRTWYTQQRLINGDRWVNSGYVFIQDNGQPMNPDSFTGWMAKFSKKYGLPHIHPHKFRHTMASLLYFNGLDSVAISKRLGHAKVSTTTDIYSHIIKQADERASECIADVILRPKKQNAG